MKLINLISFYYKEDFLYPHKDNLHAIKQSLYLHINNMEIFGWDKSNFVLKTNFDFAHKNIQNTPFRYNQCINLFLTKIVAAYEVLSEHPNSVLWQHDHDTYQIKAFDIAKLQKDITSDINMCQYWETNNKPQAASIFYNGMSKTLQKLYEYILLPNKDFFKYKYGDEEVFLHFKNLGYDINTSLSFAYNTSLTKYTWNKRKDNNPYCLHGNLINSRFDKKQYRKYETNSLMRF